MPQDPTALLAALASFAPQRQGQSNPLPVAPPALPFVQNGAFPPPPGFMPPPPPQAPVVTPTQPSDNAGQPAGVQEIALQILQAMQTGAIGAEQGLQVLKQLAAAQNSGIPFPPQPPVAAPQAPFAQNAAQPERHEENGSRHRDRSRSPDYGRRQSPRRSPPQRRNSPTYGSYDPNAGTDGSGANDRNRGRGRNRGGRNDRNEYRQRTPPPQRPSAVGNAPGPSSKFIEWDRSLPRDHIRVLSRTLFVGGASGTESEIRSIFSQYGQVQSCIVNQEKRHAFVKMLTRPDALAAKAGMDATSDPAALSKARQV